MSEEQARIYPFTQVDVFTDHIFGGNPLAVFLDGEGLSDAEMQAIAREMNLSETTFLLPPTRDDCVALVRIFTPGRELPFAGHPTVGSAFILSNRGMVPNAELLFSLEEGVGLVPVRLEGDAAMPSFIWMLHPPARFEEPLAERATIAAALGLSEADLLPNAPIQAGSTGVSFLYVPLRDPETVDRAQLDVPAYLTAMTRVGREAPGVFVFAPNPQAGSDSDAQVYSRMFGAHAVGIAEDPATGSASGPLGAYLVRQGLVPLDGEAHIVSEQGTKMGSQSFIHILVRHFDDESAEEGELEIEVGGQVVPVLDGVLTLE